LLDCAIHSTNEQYFAAKIGKMDALFEANFLTIEESAGRVLSKCGKCAKNMKYIPNRPARLHCATCDTTYALPQQGSIKLFMGKTCPLDGFELVLFSAGGAAGKTFPLCPYCFTTPPFDGFARGMGCDSCPHPTCKNSMVRLRVTGCPECADGALCFDPTSGPKWKMCCNTCNYLVHFVEHAHKVRLLDDTCAECDACRLIDVDFHQRLGNPLRGGETRRAGCLFCDAVLNATAASEFGRVTKPRGGGGGRGRRGGRGRGGGGGGRGRGRGAPIDPRMTFDGF
jgi:DNA topoisomerase-3